jgi:amino acid transporter
MSMIHSKFRAFYDLLRYGKNGSQDAGYGTLYGVYLPGVLAMFGVIIYLRLGWITGSVGLPSMILIICISCAIVFITALSVSSAATNRDVEGGGTYYMISRSLGLEIGSAVGIPLFIAQAMCISFCAMGFAESLSSILPNVPLSYIAIGALCAMMALNFSTGIALNTQFVIFIIFAASLISLILGQPILQENGTPPFLESMKISFWTGFAIFFPAATGVEAAVSMSGELHSPRKSVPFGTIAVMITGFIVYLSLAFFLWTSVPRSLLVTNELILIQVAPFPALITAGIWAATLSSVLGGLIVAPRTLQALARDSIVSQSLAKEFGDSREPRLAAFLCFLIALICICFGSINKIAPILTMFYLIAYAVLNLATGLEELLNNPSWRPTFRVPWYISISGFFLCLMAMLMIDSGSSLISIALVISTYFYIRRKKISSKWEDIRQGVLLFLSRFAIYRLSGGNNPFRSWRPNFLVFSSNPMKISNMLNLTATMTKDKGFLTLVSVFSPAMADQEKIDRWKKMVHQFLNEKKIEALVELSIDSSFFSGAKKFLTAYGIGLISPNTVVFGAAKNHENMNDYFKVIELAQEAQKNVIILREEEEKQSPKRKSIDVWWDDESKKNSELMILLSHMLSTSQVWQRASIRLCSIVPNEIGKAKRLEYFNHFLSTSRLSAHPEIYVSEKNNNAYQMASLFSSQADLVFLGLRTKHKEESLESYGAYYSCLQEETKNLEHVVFVINSDQTDLTEIFK